MRNLFLAVSTLVFFASPAKAEWWEAETSHFIVYSDSTANEASELAVRLEKFDKALRFLQAMPQEEEPLARSSKLTLFQFGSQRDIGRLAGSSSVAGFFIPIAGRSVAFVPYEGASLTERSKSMFISDDGGMDPESTLFHEYAHYFMFQHAPAAYPAWYVEGSAETYGTMVLYEDGFRLGEPATERGYSLDRWRGYSVADMFDPPEKMYAREAFSLYALGWLTTHYLTFSNERSGQLGTYLDLINQGVESPEAARQAFGDLDALNRELLRYRKGKFPVIDVHDKDYVQPTARLRRLNEDEAARMSLRIELAAGVTEDEAQKLVEPARRLLERFPGSVPVLLTVAEAEFDAKNLAEAEAAAGKVVELDPENAAGHLFLADIAMERAKEVPAQFAVARREYIAANRLENDNPRPLHGYYLSYVRAGEQPPENALIALERAQQLAGFDEDIRISLAMLYLQEERPFDTLTVLGPIINDPHPGKRTKLLRAAANLIEEGKLEEAYEAMASLPEPGEEGEGEDDPGEDDPEDDEG